MPKYVDHGLYASHAAAPTWGAAQDGDGTAIGAATSATVSIDLSAATAAAGATFVIMGATLTCVASGAAANQFNAGAGATLVANLVTAINRSTNAQTCIAAPHNGTSWTTPKVQDTVFARIGTPTTTLQIMTRAGSAAYNAVGTISTSGLTGGTFGPYTFSGGVSGAWGWLFNPTATAFGSAIGIGAYGVWGAQKTLAGALVAGDVVKVRSGNKNISVGNNVTVTINPAAMGSLSNPVWFDIDNSTEWADGANPTLKISVTASSGGGYGFNFGSTLSTAFFAHIKGVQYASGQRNLIFEASTTGAQTNVAYTHISLCMPVRFENVEVVALGAPATTSSYAVVGGSSVSVSAFQSATFVNLKLTWPGQSTNLISMGSGGYNYRAEFYGCEFAATAAVTATTGLINIFNNSTHRLLLDSCKFTGLVTGSRLFPASSTTTGNNTAILRNCSLGNANVLGPNTLTSAAGEMEAGERGVFISSQYGYRDFVYERAGRVYVEWIKTKDRPTLNAVLHDGVTPWSIYAVPTTVAAQIGELHPVEIPLIGKIVPPNSELTQGVRTLKLNFLMDSTVTLTKADISAVVTYSNTDGTVALVDTFDPDGAALTTETAAWSSSSWNGQTWVKRSFTVTTPTEVLSESQVGFVVRFHKVAGADTLGLIIDPEVLIT